MASFEKTLFEACGRCGWMLHALVIMPSHFNLTLEMGTQYAVTRNVSERLGGKWKAAKTEFDRLTAKEGALAPKTE